ncbi:excinuclease ABC subunit A [Kocuria rhizophila]|uniref:excinuclease ABC subunit UvrA n=1 Tax=Kocuria rhizophila TaxID=72000 RepID=UPI0010741DB5|nr:excinuclease ABC subunit UvrA [Kocuria rhizophila]TFI04688.1 excinuclease ABC subunit A [Kocuria rhizophila]
MALTASVKEELAHLQVRKSAVRAAELSALLRFAGGLHIVGGRIVVEAELDTESVARRAARTVGEVFGHDCELGVISGGGLRRDRTWVVRVARDGEALARRTGLLDAHGRPVRGLPPTVVNGSVEESAAVIRGAFLAHGSLTEPGRAAAMEFTCPGPEAALALVGSARRLDVLAKARQVRGVDRVVVRDGIGSRLEVDEDLVVPNPDLSLVEGAIAPWSLGKATSEYWNRLLAGLGKEVGFDMVTPWKDLPAKARKAVLEGKDHKVTVAYRNRWGRERKYSQGFEGVYGYIKRKHEETESDHAKDRYEQYMRQVACPACGGARLNPTILGVTVGGKSIAEATRLPMRESLTFFEELELSDRDAQIGDQVLKEIVARLTFLIDVGLDYLNLERAAATLSGGEAQRIRLATQIGAGLVGVLYVLDEPSIGLHQRDNRRLIDTLLRLRDMGNTLIVVEHDEDTMREADWIVDVGPGAGIHGGDVVHSGTYEQLLENRKSITADYLTGRSLIEVPARRRPVDRKRQLTVVGAKENNLQNLTVDFPLGVFVAVTGVSGSGKSTLVNDILYTSLANQLNGAKQVPGRHRRIDGLEHLDKVVHVDQSPIGRTPRSNPATYTGVFDRIRKLFAETQEAKVRGYQQGRFSFNVKGGRCEACSGDGTLKIEMNFLPDVYVPCEVCKGARYNRETLEVHYKGKNIAEVLDMPIEEAAEFFAPFTAIARYLNTLVEVGLGYVRLGQPATTLSGGEAQRVKLAAELQKRSNGRTIYVLDEPTTGLHFEDIRKLLKVLQSLVDKGNSVMTIEHNLDVVKSADWIVDLGPNGGSGGGTVVAQGTPEEVAENEDSFTGQFLREVLENSAARESAHRAGSPEPVAAATGQGGAHGASS